MYYAVLFLDDASPNVVPRLQPEIATAIVEADSPEHAADVARATYPAVNVFRAHVVEVPTDVGLNPFTWHIDTDADPRQEVP